MIDLRQRSTEPELMDVQATDLATVEACLRDLERINRWTGAYRITLRWLERVLDRHRPARPLVVVDVGSGYGDMLRRIAAFAEREGVAVDLIGVDLNPYASVAAVRATPPEHPIRYLTRSVLDLSPALRPDVVISALFAHHLDDARLVRFLHWMDERARLGWLINDLHRHAVPYLIARFAPAPLRMNRMVRNDLGVGGAGLRATRLGAASRDGRARRRAHDRRRLLSVPLCRRADQAAAMTTAAEALVIGGGPAGAAVASRLAAAGRAVILCERQARPSPQVCGEFISASAVEELRDLGITATLLGAAEIRRARVVVQDLKADAALPFVAYGLSRARLDATLLDLAARHGVEVRRGARVRSLTRTDGGWQALLSDGRRILSRTVLLASGKHELRGHQRVWTLASDCVGFKMHWRLHPEQEAALGPGIELFLYQDGYAGLQPIEGGVANLCLVMSATTFQTCGASFAAALAHLRQLSPALDERLRDAIPLWASPASIARLPYGYLCRASDCADDLYRVGDQIAVIPSFTGEGIAIALRTARLAAEAVEAGVPAIDFVATARRHVRWPMQVAALLETLTRRQVVARPVLRLARSAGVLPTLARATRLQDGTTSIADPSRVCSGPLR